MTTQAFHSEPHTPERKKLGTIAGGGTAAEAISGLGAGTLGVLGLAGVLPFYMASIGVIAAGAALFIEGISVGGAYAKLVHDYPVEQAGPAEETEVAGGLGAQGLGGAVAIVLGILSLIGILPHVLLAISILVLGAVMLLAGPARAELSYSALEVRHADARSRRLASQAVQATSGVLMLVGIGAVVLGILALVGAAPTLVLTLAALVAIGAAELLGGSSMLGRLTIGLRH